AITFTYDINGILNVTTRIVSTGKEAMLVVDRSSQRLSDSARAAARERLSREWTAGASSRATTERDAEEPIAGAAASSSPPDARFQLGEALYGASDFAGAARQLEKALSLSPEHANARRLLVRAYVRDQRAAVAERTLREGIVGRPSDPALRDMLGELLEQAGR